MESLKLLQWISTQLNGVTCDKYADYAKIRGNHASKDLSRFFKRGFLERERIGKSFLYKITKQGLFYLAKKTKSINEINKKDMENKSLKAEIGIDNFIIANLMKEKAELREERDFYKFFSMMAFITLKVKQGHSVAYSYCGWMCIGVVSKWIRAFFKSDADSQESIYSNIALYDNLRSGILLSHKPS